MFIGVYNDRHHPLEKLTPERISSYVSEASTQGIQILFYTITDVNLTKQTILARIYKESDFVIEEHPIPLLTFNESSSTDDKKLDSQKELLLRNHTHFVANLIGNKTRIQTILSSHAEFEEFIIPSTSLLSIGDFIKTRHLKRLLLKPINEAKGRGIIQVLKGAGDRYHLTEVARISVVNWSQLSRQLTLLSQKKNYLIQPFLDCRATNGSPYHIRVHIARGAGASWYLLYTLVDVAPPSYVISNTELSQTYRAEEFLQKEFGSIGLEVHNQLIDLTFRMADTLDEHYPFTIDELAFDFGITRDRNVYFFEANTGPEIVYDRAAREMRRSRVRMQYVKTLHEALSGVNEEQHLGKLFKVNKGSHKQLT